MLQINGTEGSASINTVHYQLLVFASGDPCQPPFLKAETEQRQGRAGVFPGCYLGEGLPQANGWAGAQLQRFLSMIVPPSS
jgi:hypothetical protein